MQLLQKFRETTGKADKVVRNYPMVLLMGFLASISLICFAHRGYDYVDSNFVFVKFTMVCCLGISLMFALTMLSQRIGKEFPLQVLGVIFLFFFYFLLPQKKEDFTEVHASFVIPTFILSHLLVSFIAFFGQKRELNFWQYNKNLFINFFLTAVFTGVLTGGVELAILATDKLFDFNFNERYYADTFYFLSIFGSCFVFLLFNEKGLNYLEKDDQYPVVLKFFTQYILIPLLIIYAVILYFYAAKILINWELPRGWVSYLILAYSVVGILALLLVHPLKHDSTKSWVKMFSKIFYYTLAPLIVLLFTAIFTRILEYGYTEPRYFVLIIAIWLTSVVLYFILVPKATIKFVPVSLFAFGLFALIMPYFNTFSVAKRSQKNELKNILAQNNLLENSKINFSKKVSDTVADEVANKFYFLSVRNEKPFLLSLLKPADQKQLSKSLDKKVFWMTQNEVRNNFKQIETTKKSSVQAQLELVTENKIHSVSGYDYVVTLTDFQRLDFNINGDNFVVDSFSTYPVNFNVTLNGQQKWDVSREITAYLKNYKNQSGTKVVPEISMENDLENYHVKIIFTSLVHQHFEREGIYYTSAYILIRKK